MAGKRRITDETIITKLREAEVLLSQGMALEDIFKQLGVSKQTYYRWRAEYGGLDANQARELRELKRENARLKSLVADLSLDNAILKEVVSKK